VTIETKQAASWPGRRKLKLGQRVALAVVPVLAAGLIRLLG
jgi:hypothetical protein